MPYVKIICTTARFTIIVCHCLFLIRVQEVGGSKSTKCSSDVFRVIIAFYVVFMIVVPLTSKKTDVFVTCLLQLAAIEFYLPCVLWGQF